MNVNEASMICLQKLTSYPTGNQNQLYETNSKHAEKRRKLSDLPEHYHNKYNKNELHFCLISGTEVHTLNELSHLIFVSILESYYYLLRTL